MKPETKETDLLTTYGEAAAKTLRLQQESDALAKQQNALKRELEVARSALVQLSAQLPEEQRNTVFLTASGDSFHVVGYGQVALIAKTTHKLASL